jgi:hypothetical protein
MAKKRQWELITSMTGEDMPFQIFAKDRPSALRHIKKHKYKHEKIISLKEVKW